MSEKKELTVYKDNYLVEASYKLSLMEQRIILFAISQLNPREPQREHSFSVSDLLAFYPDLEPSSAYRHLKDAVYKLSERWVRTEDPEKIREFRWVSSRTYFKDEGKININFTPEIMPYLSQLEGQFTKYQLENISSFRSTYAIRIYELLTQYKNLGEREIPLDELRNLLQVSDKYPRFNSFNQRVLEPAIKEINNKSDFEVAFKTVSKIRKVVAIIFSIKNKKSKTQNQANAKQPELCNEKTEKTRKIHGVFEEIARPQVAKGSVAEGEWAVKNLSQVRKTLRERGIYSGGDLDNNLHTIPTEWLKVISKFAKICDRYLSRAVSDELFNRKEKI